ncbi:hypothetical protein ACTNE0_05485 [Bacillota bacterium HCP3S3_E9]
MSIIRRSKTGTMIIVFVKCRKCKFDGALSLAYFRRVKRYQAYQNRLAQRLI